MVTKWSSRLQWGAQEGSGGGHSGVEEAVTIMKWHS